MQAPFLERVGFTSSSAELKADWSTEPVLNLDCLLYYLLVMGDIEKLGYNNLYLKFHGYCKYRDISKLVVRVHPL